MTAFWGDELVTEKLIGSDEIHDGFRVELVQRVNGWWGIYLYTDDELEWPGWQKYDIRFFLWTAKRRARQMLAMARSAKQRQRKLTIR